MPTVTEVINIFEKIQCYCVQNINEQLFSLLPNLKFNISCNIKSMLVPNAQVTATYLDLFCFNIYNLLSGNNIAPKRPFNTC